MRVGLISYPMLFQRKGGLQVQVLETIAALNGRGIEAKLVDPNGELLADYDLIHVFSVINGNHRIVEAAKAAERPVVTSPLIRPSWTRAMGRKAALVDSLAGRATGWQIQTTYREIKTALDLSDRLVALGDIEKTAIEEAFGISEHKVVVVPNGISARFFSATPDEFVAKTGIAPGFVLNVASINPHKNQIALVQALKGSPHRVVLVGPTLPEDRDYLAELEKSPNVTYLGPLAYDDPLLCSAYAAAAVFVLPSHDEVMPLSVMESLAAGRPVVMTRNHCMRLDGAAQVLREVDPNAVEAIREATLYFLERPPAPSSCRDAMVGYTWESVAGNLIETYRAAMS